MERNCNNCKNPDCFWVGLDDDEICDEYLPKTNADRIRSMTDEELARFLQGVTLGLKTPLTDWVDWLKQEAER